jgi:transcriptional regulator with XRE-family HTH domain
VKRTTLRRWCWVDADEAAFRQYCRPGRPGSSYRPSAVRERVIRAAVGREIRKQRTRREWSQLELGRRLAVSGPQVSYLEAGRTAFDLSLLWDLGDVFDLEPWHFVAIATMAVASDVRNPLTASRSRRARSPRQRLDAPARPQRPRSRK